MDQDKIGRLSEHVFNDVNAAMNVLNLYLGYRLDLFRTMSRLGPTTSTELADETHYSERYLREWLECLAVNDYLDYDSRTRRFGLSPEHAAVLVDRDSRAFSAPFACYIPSFSSVLPELMRGFRDGRGVPYALYGPDLLEGLGSGNRPMFVNDYVVNWIPTMPDIQHRLAEGGRVAEVGCGVGFSSIVLAQGFPRVRIDGIDVDAASLEEAKRNAARAGLADRITFHQGSIEESSLPGPYDLVTAFECVHDMPYPVRALRRMHENRRPPRGGVGVGRRSGRNPRREPKPPGPDHL